MTPKENNQNQKLNKDDVIDAVKKMPDEQQQKTIVYLVIKKATIGSCHYKCY